MSKHVDENLEASKCARASLAWSASELAELSYAFDITGNKDLANRLMRISNNVENAFKTMAIAIILLEDCTESFAMTNISSKETSNG
jgi:hypothetical protein